METKQLPTPNEVVEETKRLEVKEILTSLEKINPDEVSKEDGLLDFDKLKARPELQEAVKKLDEMRITRTYLLKYFNIAGLVMGHLLKNNY